MQTIATKLSRVAPIAGFTKQQTRHLIHGCGGSPRRANKAARLGLHEVLSSAYAAAINDGLSHTQAVQRCDALWLELVPAADTKPADTEPAATVDAEPAVAKPTPAQRKTIAQLHKYAYSVLMPLGDAFDLELCTKLIVAESLNLGTAMRAVDAYAAMDDDSRTAALASGWGAWIAAARAA